MLIRLGEPDESHQNSWCKNWQSIFRLGRNFVDRELAKLLIAVEAPGITEKVVKLLVSSRCPGTTNRLCPDAQRRPDRLDNPAERKSTFNGFSTRQLSRVGHRSVAICKVFARRPLHDCPKKNKSHCRKSSRRTGKQGPVCRIESTAVRQEMDIG